jgi:hypothetical protein
MARQGGHRTGVPVLHIHEPHAPHTPPARFEAFEAYDGEIAYVDELVGGFVKYLTAHQLYDQSTIILTADHGEGLGDHGESGHGVLAYEEALRIPLIIKPAAGEGAGRRVNAVVQHVDIVPTILDLAKAPLHDRLSGRSLKPLLEGAAEFPARVVYSESFFNAYRFGWSRVRSVTDGRYRLVRAEHDELYDLDNDPAEERNVATEHPAELNRLRAALDQIVADDHVAEPTPQPGDVTEKLAALGYVGEVASIDPDAVAMVDGSQQIEIVETLRAALASAVNRQLPEAIQILDGLVRRYPLIAAAWHQLGDFAATAGRMDRAVGRITTHPRCDRAPPPTTSPRRERCSGSGGSTKRGSRPNAGFRQPPAIANRKPQRMNCSPGLLWSGAIRPRRESRPGSLARPTRSCRLPPSSKGGSSTMPASWMGRSGRLMKPSLTSRSPVRGPWPTCITTRAMRSSGSNGLQKPSITSCRSCARFRTTFARAGRWPRSTTRRGVRTKRAKS